MLGDEAMLHPDEINEILDKYQKPEELDKIYRLKVDLEDIKEIMHKNISQLHLNKEQLDNLIKTTDELSKSSKIFATNAKKLNRCCNLI